MSIEARSLLAALWLFGPCAWDAANLMAYLELFDLKFVQVDHMGIMSATVLGKQSARAHNLKIEVMS